MKRKLPILEIGVLLAFVAIVAAFAPLRPGLDLASVKFSHGGTIREFPVVEEIRPVEVEGDKSHRYYEVHVLDLEKSSGGEHQRLKLVGKAMREYGCPDHRITDRRFEKDRVPMTDCRLGEHENCPTSHGYSFYYTARLYYSYRNRR